MSARTQRARVDDAQRQADSRLRDGWPFAALEAWIDALPLTEDERAAVWLYAFCVADRLPADRPRRLVAVWGHRSGAPHFRREARTSVTPRYEGY